MASPVGVPRAGRCTGAAVVLVLFGATVVSAQAPAEYFEQYCFACHTVGEGPLVGPDLKDVGLRRDRDWLVRFIENPQAVLDSGDADAQQLVDDAGGMVMPTSPGMTRELAVALLDLIEAQSQNGPPASNGASAAVSAPPFTDQDIALGRNLFAGHIPPAGGGPSCVSCHQVAGLTSVAGGRLGPDLTDVYERLSRRRGLTAWLSAPATPTMQAVYGTRGLTAEEVDGLVAFLELAATDSAPPDPPSAWVFLACGLGGGIVGLVILSSAWRARLRAVRRTLVEAARPGGTS